MIWERPGQPSIGAWSYHGVNVQSSSLFRAEALRHRADRLQGNVNIALPLAWQVIGLLFVVILVAAAVFLGTGTYERVETVSGTIVPEKGVATIIPSRAGLVQTILVSEGDQVKAGQRLAVIRVDDNLIVGATAADRIDDALNRQDSQLADQNEQLIGASIADRQRLKAQIDGDLAAIAALNLQISDQRELIASAEADYDSIKAVAARGYISKRDMEERRATILTRRQQLSQLQQAVSDKKAGIAQAQTAMIESTASARAQTANVQSTREALRQQQAQTELSRGFALTSPMDGTVTALTARPGQPAAPGQQLMMVVPARSEPRVELYVPTAAAGFLASGQEVRLSIDAYPYQTFGTIEARIICVSKAAVAHQTKNAVAPAYLVVAAIPRPWMVTFGRKQPLLPGMTLSARIVTEKRSLIGWLFEPLYAVRSR